MPRRQRIPTQNRLARFELQVGDGSRLLRTVRGPGGRSALLASLWTGTRPVRMRAYLTWLARYD